MLSGRNIGCGSQDNPPSPAALVVNNENNTKMTSIELCRMIPHF